MKKQTLFLIIMSLIVMTTVYSQEYSTQKNVVFDVVDIITFNSENKISHLDIIYDTVISRALTSKLKIKK